MSQNCNAQQNTEVGAAGPEDTQPRKALGEVASFKLRPAG